MTRNGAPLPDTDGGLPDEVEARPSHDCRFVERLVWSDWSRAGSLAERLARRLILCADCGRLRTPRRPRPPALREVRAEVPAAVPLADEIGRAVAAALDRSANGKRTVYIRGLFGDLARRGIPASLAEDWLDVFLHAGWLTSSWRLGASPRLSTVTLVQPEALREFARPGEEVRRRSALHEARERVARLTHPKAVEITALLRSFESGGFPPPLLQALAALAIHAESGEVLAERVFSARHLGGSKVLAGLRGRLERLLGPLAEIGIREGVAVSLLGGQGVLRLAGQDLDLQALPPFLGLSRETLEGLREIAFPPGGLFVVENLTAFEACCRGEMEAACGALIAWSAGYPGRSIRRLVELADTSGVPLRIWADLDLDGIRIARLIASWSSAGAAFHRMSPEDLAAASHRHPLTKPSLAAIRRDLEERPGAPLAGTLRALLGCGSWVEQEALLG